ncbi:MAG: hypothetical protein E7052_04520 [Lentisphaerae bacterium]|nr:hypothetical protein [Lentisphaerota bacterium]
MQNIEKIEQVLILGLGGGGGKVVEKICQLPEAAGIQLCVFDTDRGALERLTGLPEECKVLCNEQWLLGHGTGGDPLKGQRALASESGKLQQFMSNAKLLIIVGGLGGGTATGGAGVISRLAHSHNLAAVSLFELPFAFEGHGRRKTAEDGMRELLALSDTILGIPNDLLFSVLPAETTFADAFQLADTELARTVLGIVDVLMPGNLLSGDMGDLITMLKNRKSYAAIGVGSGNEAVALDSCVQALSGVLDSPFLGGAQKLKEADAVLLSVTGGSELTYAELKRTLEQAGTLTGLTSQVIVGANIRSTLTTQVRITAIAVKYDEADAVVRPEQKAAKVSRRKIKRQPDQPTLPLTIASSGIFEGKTGTIVDGVNLDLPTFVRKQIAIDSGE